MHASNSPLPCVEVERMSRDDRDPRRRLALATRPRTTTNIPADIVTLDRVLNVYPDWERSAVEDLELRAIWNAR
jgi:hypothetical protein